VEARTTSLTGSTVGWSDREHAPPISAIRFVTAVAPIMRSGAATVVNAGVTSPEAKMSLTD
jgi:hypothetical protein